MIATCEICKGTGETFHPGQAAPAKCWKCEQYGNHVDAVVAYMRAMRLPVNRIEADRVYGKIFANCYHGEEKATAIINGAMERLQ